MHLNLILTRIWKKAEIEQTKIERNKDRAKKIAKAILQVRRSKYRPGLKKKDFYRPHTLLIDQLRTNFRVVLIEF